MESSNGYGFDLSSGPNFELDWFFITHPYSAVGRCTLLSIVIEKRIMLFHDVCRQRAAVNHSFRRTGYAFWIESLSKAELNAPLE